MIMKKNIFAHSDIATLILAGMGNEKILLKGLGMESDGLYFLRVCDQDVEIPDYYKKVWECRCWLKIYDDHGLAYFLNNEYNRFEVYQAGMTVLIKEWAE